MPIRRELPAFWWFRHGRIGGMSRPGFNRVEWEKLELEESVLASFVGKLRSPCPELADLERHLCWFTERVHAFGDLGQGALAERMARLLDWDAAYEHLRALDDRYDLLGTLEHTQERGEKRLEIELNSACVRREVDQLEQHGPHVIVALTEQPPDPLLLQSDLEVHHVPVDDMLAPSLEQVELVADLMHAAQVSGRGIAVHCLAGIGRTTTMLMAAHLLEGHDLQRLRALVADANPRFTFHGPQAEFLERLAAQAC